MPLAEVVPAGRPLRQTASPRKKDQSIAPKGTSLQPPGRDGGGSPEGQNRFAAPGGSCSDPSGTTKGESFVIGDCKDRKLADEGRRRIEWAGANMPVLAGIRQEWEKDPPLRGLRLAACLHVTTETANLMLALKAGGASPALCASNPLSTQDDVAAALNEIYQVPTFAVRGEDQETYYRHIHKVLDAKPQVTMDDGADLVSTLHSARSPLMGGVAGGTEETTTGVIRLRALEREGLLKYPIVAVNDAQSKHMFDNRYGTGQSTMDGILRATNYLIAGSTFVVVGYGWCGRGIASRARGLGANVIVVETDPLKALEAAMDGYRVAPMREAAGLGDILVSATGNINVMGRGSFKLMKDGAILANSGHFDVEIDVKSLRETASQTRFVRENVEEFVLDGGKRLRLLAEGRLVNLGAAEGHPAQVMDMSFANQALCTRWILEQTGSSALERRVYSVPPEIDREVARLKLRSMGIEIDELTDQQKEYLSSWHIGT
ncbi:MAG: adenosylhomocysteinase [Firmicutes bacterium]|nr:adenosylhomocysteinase [Bacillota bacterium]